MPNSAFYVPKSALVIVAHPDDIDFTCAGTIARWVKNGTRVGYVICTSGQVGIAEKGMTIEQAANIREQEQSDAAAVVGVTDVTYLREMDGMLTPSMDLRKKLVREIRRFKPEVVITGDPTIVFANSHYINHPDHRAASQAALDAVFPAAGQPNLFEELAEEGLQAHKTRKVYITGAHPDAIAVNITDTIDLKIEALKQHVSQMNGNDPTERIREWAADAAKGKEMVYAEMFRVYEIENDEKWRKLHPDDFED